MTTNRGAEACPECPECGEAICGPPDHADECPHDGVPVSEIRTDDGTSTGGSEHRVRESGFDGRVREYVRDGRKEDLDMLAVEEFVTARYGSLDGPGSTEVQEAHTRLTISEKHAHGVMLALADYYGCEVRPK